jgi:hypothetical protein
MGEPFTTSDLSGEAGNMTEAELAAALGEEVPVEEAPAPEPAAEAPADEAWVHEPTGKSFDSEIELLRYESGWKDNKYGNELKETRAKLEAFEKLLDGAGAEPAQAQVDPEKQEELLLKRVLDGTGVNLDEVDAGAYKTIFKMIENALGLYDTSVVGKRFDELKGSVEKITTRAQEAEAYNKAGIQTDAVMEVLEKRPYLKQLAPGDRAAVIADLVKAQEAPKAEGESPNALRQALQPDKAGHVEGSAGTQHLDGGEELAERELASKLDGNDRDFLRALGAETAKAGAMPWLAD